MLKFSSGRWRPKWTWSSCQAQGSWECGGLCPPNLTAVGYRSIFAYLVYVRGAGEWVMYIVHLTSLQWVESLICRSIFVFLACVRGLGGWGVAGHVHITSLQWPSDSGWSVWTELMCICQLWRSWGCTGSCPSHCSLGWGFEWHR